MGKSLWQRLSVVLILITWLHLWLSSVFSLHTVWHDCVDVNRVMLKVSWKSVVGTRSSFIEVQADVAPASPFLFRMTLFCHVHANFLFAPVSCGRRQSVVQMKWENIIWNPFVKLCIVLLHIHWQRTEIVDNKQRKQIVPSIYIKGTLWNLLHHSKLSHETTIQTVENVNLTIWIVWINIYFHTLTLKVLAILKNNATFERYILFRLNYILNSFTVKHNLAPFCMHLLLQPNR